MGTILSTLVVGVAFWKASRLFAAPLPLPWALLFGALISPTDPVAVLATLKRITLPERLRVELEGEALFNDGVGVVLFTLLLGFVAGANPDGAADVSGVAELVALEVGGGLALGSATGYLAYRAMHAVDDFRVEVMITLALATATYAIADRLGASGPLAVVVAGVLVGNRGRRLAMSDETQRYVTEVWTIIDEVLNSLLFLLIGLEVLVLRTAAFHIGLTLAAVPIALVARALALGAPFLVRSLRTKLSARNLPFLTWAGVRGGISVALALSLPNAPEKPTLLAATYAVVLFTIVFQSTTLPRLAAWSLDIGQDRAGRP
jgi:monovalent cation:H+ antiporter, CPA1 family